MIDISLACKPDLMVVENLRANGFDVKDYGFAEGFWTLRISPAKPTPTHVGRICQIGGVSALTLVQWREVT